MRRLWLFPSLALLATGCPSDDTSATNEDTGTDNGDDDDDDDASDEEQESSSVSINPDSSGDDSVGTTTDGTADSGTTMVGPICGDGTVDEGEECDDENMVDGDACTAECTIPFEVLWTATHNGSASNRDQANKVLVDGDGVIYVVGNTRNTSTGRDVWLQQYMPDGTEGWTYEFDGEDSLDEVGASMVFDADGNLVVVGATETAATTEDILVLVVDVATQELIGTPIVIDGPGMPGPNESDDTDSADDVAIDPSGNIVVAGTVRADAESWNIWVGEIDPAAMEPLLWEQSLNGPDSGPDGSQAVHVADDGTVYVLANQELAGNISNGIVLVYGDDGTPQEADTVELDWFVSDFEFDADGNVVVVGSYVPGNSLNDVRTTLYDSAFAEVWTAAHDGPAHGDDFGGGVAIDAMGRVVTVGGHANSGQQGDAWLGTYAGADGAPIWGDAYTSASELEDFYTDAAVTPDGDYVVVGAESVIGEQDNVFVRKYHPN